MTQEAKQTTFKKPDHANWPFGEEEEVRELVVLVVLVVLVGLMEQMQPLVLIKPMKPKELMKPIELMPMEPKELAVPMQCRACCKWCAALPTAEWKAAGQETSLRRSSCNGWCVGTNGKAK